MILSGGKHFVRDGLCPVLCVVSARTGPGVARTGSCFPGAKIRPGFQFG